MEEINNDDNIEKELEVYGKDINGKYIIRKRDKCIFGIIIFAAVSVSLYNLYLISSVIYMTPGSNT